MIFMIIGKSASGKNAIYENLLNNNKYNFNTIIQYTTRPIRANEENGKDYNFVTEDDFINFREENKIVESRIYNTSQGLWRYFTVDENIDPNKLYLTIGTLDSFKAIQFYYRKTTEVIPIYIYASDRIRLERAIKREEELHKQKIKKALENNMDITKIGDVNLTEVCRRFVADNEDFSDDMVEEAFRDCPLLINFCNDKSYNNLGKSCLDDICKNINYEIDRYLANRGKKYDRS